jgi:aminoglycoside 6-adenylyltransferase
MRTEKEMMNLILDVAGKDERIRVVAMNGSRANPRAPKDRFQDYDIVYMVTEMEPFISDNHWVKVFGEQIIMQTPERMNLFPPESNTLSFHYLMLFADGNRIDLTFLPLGKKKEYIASDSLIVLLLDKDNCMPEIPISSDKDYWVIPPTKVLFNDCCNEFWWVSTYVAKGLWRKELLYANYHLNDCVRPMLIKMLEWQIGTETDFSLSIGKCGKYLEKYLSKETWDLLTSTYLNDGYDNIWNSLFICCDLFRESGKLVSKYFGYDYPLEEDRKVTSYLKYIKSI